MKFMKLGSKPDCFQNDGKDIRFVTANLAADIIVHIGNAEFHLHKFPLLSKSYRIQKLLETSNSNEDETDEISIPDIPGGAAAFELCAKFCYGMTLTLNAHNVAAARCAAEYLEMHETVDRGNFIYKIEVFLRTSIFRSWKDSIIVLQMTRSLVPWAEDLKLINHCIDSIATKACTDASKVEWSYTYNRKKNGATKENPVPKDWWVEDLCELETDFFRKVILAIKTKAGVSSEVIGEALKVYTYRRFSSSSKESAKNEGNCINASFVETIISLLPTEKGCVSCSFLLKLLRAGCLLNFGETSKKELVRRIGCRLEGASVTDLLIPAASEEKTIYDVDIIISIVKEFMTREDNKSVPEEHHQELSSPALASGSSAIAIAKLVDGYLVEIAKDPNLPLFKFISLAEILPSESRSTHDELYRAINTFLKEHPGVGKSERKKLCSLINCRKLSVDSCTHAVQNERLPLRMVVQVLYFEQMRVSTCATSQVESRGSYGSSRSAIATNAEDESDGTAVVALGSPLSTKPVDACNGNSKSKSNDKAKGMMTPKRVLGKLGKSVDTSGSPKSADAEESKPKPARNARQSVA